MKPTLLLSGVLAFSVLLFSCQTAPEAPPEEEPAPEPAPTEEEKAPLPEEQRTRATELRDLIAQYELSRFAEDAYAEGQEAFEQAEEAYGEDNEQAAARYETAINRYEDVVETGASELQSRWENRIAELNSEAQELKAPRALPSDYEQARTTLEEARSALEDEEYNQAANLYVSAYERHQTVVNRTREKRQRALEALEAVDSDIQSTESRIEELEREQQEFEPDAGDGGEDES